MKDRNLRKLGKQQWLIINWMFKKNYIISVLHDYRLQKMECCLQDEAGDNTYETIPNDRFQSLYDRNLFYEFENYSSTQHEVNKFRLSEPLLKYLKTINHSPNNKP